jgi:hypothetical protein
MRRTVLLLALGALGADPTRGLDAQGAVWVRDSTLREIDNSWYRSTSVESVDLPPATFGVTCIVGPGTRASVMFSVTWTDDPPPGFSRYPYFFAATKIGDQKVGRTDWLGSTDSRRIILDDLAKQANDLVKASPSRYAIEVHSAMYVFDLSGLKREADWVRRGCSDPKP